MDLTCDERLSDSPFIHSVWRNQGDGGAFISIAQPLWNMVVTRFRDQAILTLRGPEIRATSAYSPAGAEFFGIMFKPGTLMPNFPARTLMDRSDVNLPEASSQTFWLNGASWQFPDFENAETFVSRLVRDGLLIYDPLVEKVLQGEPASLSLRTVQRRILTATGITHGTLSQIERARYATRLLKQGVSILDTVEQAGYSDQPHLTRALKHLIGQTPAQIMNANREERLSFLFKT
jgi:AraC-like DNA-binding protein